MDKQTEKRDTVSPLQKLLDSLINQSNGCDANFPNERRERFILSGIIDYVKELLTTEKEYWLSMQAGGEVYEFVYNSCIHESASYTVSIHYTKDGAEKALAFHKEEKRKEWQSLVDSDEDKGTPAGFDQICPFGSMEYWGINETKILP